MQFALGYPDDIVMFSKPPDWNIGHVRQILKSIKDAGVALKLEKCEPFTNLMDCLFHVIKSGCLAVHSHIIEAIRSVQTPYNITEFRSFLTCAVVSAVFYRILHGLRPFSNKICEKTGLAFTRSYPTRSLNLQNIEENAHLTAVSHPSAISGHINNWLRRLWPTDRIGLFWKVTDTSNRSVIGGTS